MATLVRLRWAVALCLGAHFAAAPAIAIGAVCRYLELHAWALAMALPFLMLIPSVALLSRPWPGQSARDHAAGRSLWQLTIAYAAVRIAGGLYAAHLGRIGVWPYQDRMLPTIDDAAAGVWCLWVYRAAGQFRMLAVALAEPALARGCVFLGVLLVLAEAGTRFGDTSLRAYVPQDVVMIDPLEYLRAPVQLWSDAILFSFLRPAGVALLTYMWVLLNLAARGIDSRLALRNSARLYTFALPSV